MQYSSGQKCQGESVPVRENQGIDRFGAEDRKVLFQGIEPGCHGTRLHHAVCVAALMTRGSIGPTDG